MEVPVEILGMAGTKEVSESLGSFDGPVIDTDHLTRFAQAHEAAGFDRVLIAHRPGSVAPTVVGGTERAAWERAEEIRELTAKRVAGVKQTQADGTRAPARGAFRFRESSSIGSGRRQRQGAERDVHDERLWYGITKPTGPGGNSTALAGTPAQVADALSEYRKVGVDGAANSSRCSRSRTNLFTP